MFATLICDVARVRTLWLRSEDQLNQLIAILSTAAVGVKALGLVLETLNKRQSLRPEYQDYPPEATSGIFNRSFFWWLNPLFKQGYRHDLEVEDLFVIDKHLKASYEHTRFQKTWNSREYSFFLIIVAKLPNYPAPLHKPNPSMI